jgi:hypothetical protein
MGAKIVKEYVRTKAFHVNLRIIDENGRHSPYI